jgi:hypothetical protein
MTNQEKRLDILRKIQSGELSAEEGLRLLIANDASPETVETVQPTAIAKLTNIAASSIATEAPPPPAPPIAPKPPAPPVLSFNDKSRSTPVPPVDVIGNEQQVERELEAELGKWRRWWMIPFWVGVVIISIGAGLVHWGYTATHLGWGFWLTWLPFLFGLALMVLGWQSQKARWLHVRIRQKPGEKPGLIVISLPLPLGLVAWFLRSFGPFIPKIRGRHLDELLVALQQSVSPASPFYVDVNNKDGEHVEVFIG